MAKSLVTVLALTGLLAGPVAAQHNSVDFTLLGGINMANMTIEPEPDSGPDNSLRFGGGLGLGFNLSPNLSMNMNFLYMMKGAQSELKMYSASGELQQDVTAQYRLNYLVFNPALHISLTGNSTGPYLLAGAEIGYLVDAEMEAEYAYPVGRPSEQTDMQPYLHELDYAVSFGGGMQFGGGGSAAFIIEGHYVLGLADIFDTFSASSPEGSVSGLTMDWKNQGIYLLAGMRL